MKIDTRYNEYTVEVTNGIKLTYFGVSSKEVREKAIEHGHKVKRVVLKREISR